MAGRDAEAPGYMLGGGDGERAVKASVRPPEPKQLENLTKFVLWDLLWAPLMLLRVKNLGPVREAELDLGKPLIVLTGPNNSGKTYLAWAAYSLARLHNTLVEPPAALRTLAERMLDSATHELKLDELLTTQGEVLRATEEALRRQLPIDFAAPRDQFGATRFEVVPERSHGRFADGAAYLLPYHPSKLRIVSFHAFVLDAGRLIWTSAKVDEGQSNEDVLAELASCLVSFVAHSSLDRQYVAFPVERLSINLFARELAAARTELVDELLSDAAESIAPTTMRHKLQRRAGRYPLVIRDALQTAIRLSSKDDIGPMAELADELEASVLGGRVVLDANDELRFIPRRDPDERHLGLHESGSVVKSLASLVLHLRYQAKPGQRLVIDEPELNLHPDNQRLIARILAKAVNRGLKIMMSTHSDYVIRELNNLVMLGQDSDKARALVQELGYQPEQTLRRDQIGAYLVNDGACSHLEVTETGFETKTIEDEIHKLNHDAQTIYLRLFCD